MSKELLYILCSIKLKEKELYEVFRKASTIKELEEFVSNKFSNDDIERGKNYLKKMKGESIKVTSLLEEDYPKMLKNIDYPPPILFYKGEYLDLDENAIAFVGSRDASLKSIDIVDSYIKDFQDLPICIVSGLARGVDSIAQNKAIEYGLRTIGVLGCGIDIIYPSSNRDLFNKVIKQGCIFSEFPLGTPALPQNFPRRNRIISGLSKAVLVVESGERSGSLITARFAIEQSRELFAIPRTPLEKNSKGNNILIKNGAKIATSGKDIIEDVFPQLLKDETKKHPLVNLSKEEEEILSNIGEEPVNFDTLCFLLDKGPSTLANFLLQLELKGLIRALPGKSYTKIRS
ncbi:MAG: DNA-processing protein DprA [Proteobacteria bacterium]|nr:DNA-processing protein DprA [Pseudomonadota bacterium]